MSSLQSDEYIQWAAQELRVEEPLLRNLLNTPDPDELLQRAARMVVDRGKELGPVARIFGVNEEYLGRAVWFMKENREARKRWTEKELSADTGRYLLENPPS